MRIEVLFLSQQRLLRETLSAALAHAPEISFLPPVAETVDAIGSMLLHEPDVVMVDLNPSLFGIRVAKELQDACPRCKILALSSYPDPIAAGQLALAGVQGFLSKDIGITDLLWAIREVHAGQLIFLNVPSAAREANGESAIQRNQSLTSREAQVLELVAKGLANKQIAAELGISIKTVEKHRQRVMCKLEAHETAGLSWRAFCMGVAPAA